jgi:hypothetical protein
VRILRAVIQVPVLAVFHARQEFPLRRIVALELIGHTHARDILQALEQLTEKLLRSLLVPPALHQNVEDIPLLIYSTLEVQEHFIQVPLVAGLGPSMPELIGILLAELVAPLPNRFVSHRDATGEEELFHVAIAEAKPEIEPDCVADDLGREAMILVWVYWHGGFHRADMPHRAEPV